MNKKRYQYILTTIFLTLIIKLITFLIIYLNILSIRIILVKKKVIDQNCLQRLKPHNQLIIII